MIFPDRKGKHTEQLKRTVSSFHRCPLCEQTIEIGVEWGVLKELNEGQKFPYPHIHLHGDPLHAMLCYIDKDLKVRSVGGIKSIEISRDSETFSHLIRKWSNPY